VNNVTVHHTILLMSAIHTLL